MAAGSEPLGWGEVRDAFALTRRYAHFSAFMLASHPRPVREAIAEFEAGLDAEPQRYGLGADDFRRGEEARQAVAAYVGGEAGDVALTDSTTMGIGLVYAGLRLGPDDEVLTTGHEFYSTHESLRLRSVRDGVRVRTVRLYDDPALASRDEIVGRLRAAIGPRTRVLALTWVHSCTGVMIPLPEIAAMAAEVSARRGERLLVCVDGAHGFAVEDADVAALGCDFFMTATHKWLFGPRGTGFVWGRRDAWTALDPLIPSFSMPALRGSLSGRPPDGPPGDLNSPGGYHSYSARWALPAAFAFHHAIGRDRVAQRTRSQAAQLKDGLAGIPHVRVVTPRDPAVSSGIVCCAVDGMEPREAVARLLDEHGVSTGDTPYRESYVRVGPSIVTTPDEVDQAVRAFAALR
ncbi:aminotransferase class V-fold PLP-dependent enzyme [Actinomadura rupiterrae]|uniref:aminotransferase class V-fold PLP-dependent enzyme n=1 Tax=Actinomadura rupiterrae TaxID=559627 RepID=UPI0020A2C76F|nr:aminotransferase class V-fold PLP-dependent enzyme [Actinomadura rupiterrae]MCP2335933.1 selenocysteine lyase/cysteine desulfurase [Actinomadura rupiterrae]